MGENKIDNGPDDGEDAELARAIDRVLAADPDLTYQQVEQEIRRYWNDRVKEADTDAARKTRSLIHKLIEDSEKWR